MLAHTRAHSMSMLLWHFSVTFPWCYTYIPYTYIFHIYQLLIYTYILNGNWTELVDYQLSSVKLIV